MGNCLCLQKLPCLISNNESLLDEDVFDPEPCDLHYSNPLIASEMSESFIQSDKRATNLIRTLG